MKECRQRMCHTYIHYRVILYVHSNRSPKPRHPCFWSKSKEWKTKTLNSNNLFVITYSTPSFEQTSEQQIPSDNSKSWFLRNIQIVHNCISFKQLLLYNKQVPYSGYFPRPKISAFCLQQRMQKGCKNFFVFNFCVFGSREGYISSVCFGKVPWE